MSEHGLEVVRREEVDENESLVGFARERVGNEMKSNEDGLEPRPVLDRDAIQAILPHRDPFLFIDEIRELKPGERAVAVKHVRGSEDFFRGHFPGQPVMPGVLITE